VYCLLTSVITSPLMTLYREFAYLDIHFFGGRSGREYSMLSRPKAVSKHAA
jgi:hypothetical protein